MTRHRPPTPSRSSGSPPPLSLGRDLTAAAPRRGAGRSAPSNEGGYDAIYAVAFDADFRTILMSSTVTHTYTWLLNPDDTLHEQTIQDFARYAQDELGEPPWLCRVRYRLDDQWPASPDIGSNWQAFAVQQRIPEEPSALTSVFWRAIEGEHRRSERRFRELYAVPADSPITEGRQPFPPVPVGEATSLDFAPAQGSLEALPRWDLAWDELNPSPPGQLTVPRAVLGRWSNLMLLTDPAYLTLSAAPSTWNGFAFDQLPPFTFAELSLTNLGTGEDDDVVYRFGPRGAELPLPANTSVTIPIPPNQPLRMTDANALHVKAVTSPPTTNPVPVRVQMTLIGMPDIIEF